MRTLRTSEAATYLNVSPNTLRAWEHRFGFPRPGRSPGRHRHYAFAELVALREALADGLAVSSAVSAAREAVATDEHMLAAALTSFDYARADEAMERGLALRSLERAVMGVMLPALEDLEHRHGYGSAPWAFASRWADEWLGRAERLASPGVDRPWVLFADGSCNRLDLETLHAHVLELFCARIGWTALRLPVRVHRCLGRVTAGRPPKVIVVTGTPASEEEVEAFAQSVRSSANGAPFMQFRRNREPASRRQELSPSPLAALAEISTALAARAGGATKPAGGPALRAR